MPKIWSDTVEAHRESVRQAIMDATASLATQRGLAAVSMSDVAAEAGIARATLYKYFPDIEAILVEWHKRRIADHMRQLSAIAHGIEDPMSRLSAVLEAFALIIHEHRGSVLASTLHERQHAKHTEHHLIGFLAAMINDGVLAGQLRGDVPSRELAIYCHSALSAAARLETKTSARRLAELVASSLKA
jgi:AcrR family transcriptional regulator